MEWKILLYARRKEPLDIPDDLSKYPMNDFELDYWRIVNSAPFRRLQDKTQVFPLDKSDFVRTRLTHSMETSALAKQLADRGIRANSVAPGPIWTPLQICGGQLPENIPEFGQETPLRRAGQPAELASLYVYLASNESSYVTAEVMGVTGGMHLS